MPGPAAEVESIKVAVSKYFPVYDVKVNFDTLVFYITPNQQSLDKDFERLRLEFKDRMLIPILRYQGGEHTLSVVKRPEIKTRGLWLNTILLIVTIMTTIYAGAYLWASYDGNNDMWLMENYLWGAIFFALPLMAILGTHELSHYIAAKRCGVAASLPFFIPSIPPLGTFGAFISMRDPIPDRRSLVKIGAAGPLGGLLVTIPVTLIGLWLTSMGDPTSGAVGDGGAVAVSIQPLYELLEYLIPLPENVTLHPTAFAAWVGFLVTAINLLPAGQLDGGHVARGLFGEKAKYLSYATVVLLLILGMSYTGWLIFAILIVFLGLKHPAPLNDITKLDLRVKVLGIATLLVLLVTFSPIPLVEISPNHSFSVELPDDLNETSMSAGSSYSFTMWLNNTGNTDSDILMNVMQVPDGWSASVYLQGNETNATDFMELELLYDEGVTLVLEITVPSGESATAKYLVLDVSSLNSDNTIYKNKDVSFLVNVL